MIAIFAATFLLSTLPFLAAQDQETKKSIAQNDNQEQSIALVQKDITKTDLIDKIQKMALTIEVQPIMSAIGIETGVSKASGFWIDASGIVCTNSHVADENSVAKIIAHDHAGNRYTLSLIWSDPIHDVAFLKADRAPAVFTPIVFNNDPQFGESVMMAGNNGGNGFTVCEGRIGDKYGLMLCELTTKSLTVSLNGKPGSSGSPVLDTKGQLVGINFSGSEGASFVVPAQYIHYFLSNILEQKFPERWGVNINPKHISASEAVDYYNFPEKLALDIQKKFPDGQNRLITPQMCLQERDADNPFHVGDILYSVNGRVIGPDYFIVEEELNQIGDKPAAFVVYRQGKEMTLTIRPRNLNKQKINRMLVFGGAVFSEISPQASLFSNHPIGSVCVLNNPQTSVFSRLPSMTSNLVLARLLSINGEKIEKLDDLVQMIPQIVSKQRFNYTADVSFIFRLSPGHFPLKKELSYPADYDISLREPPFLITFDYTTRTWTRTEISTNLPSPSPSSSTITPPQGS